jgi:hypothetical protein
VDTTKVASGIDMGIPAVGSTNTVDVTTETGIVATEVRDTGINSNKRSSLSPRC